MVNFTRVCGIFYYSNFFGGSKIYYSINAKSDYSFFACMRCHGDELKALELGERLLCGLDGNPERGCNVALTELYLITIPAERMPTDNGIYRLGG